MSSRDDLLRARSFLKDTLRLSIDFRQTAQSRGEPPPPVQKPRGAEQALLPLPPPAPSTEVSLEDAINRRRSHRRYAPAPLTLAELSWLLWATQGVQSAGTTATFRPVPSAGARHAFETYLCALRVEGLEPGIYRYLSLDQALVCERTVEHLAPRLAQATLGQRWVANAAAVFAWTTLPARMEWRYDLAAHRVIALDAGHVAQNLYLACEGAGAGTCAIAAYDQRAMDELLGVDGEDEFTLYLAPVGKLGS